MSVLGVLNSILSADQVTYLLLLVLANLVLGVVSSLVAGNFQLARLGDWALKRVLPVFGGYTAAALLALAQPNYSYARDVAFYSLAAGLVGYILANLRDMGINLPDAVAGKPGGSLGK